MRVAFLGLGRLGLPVAAVLSQHHAVVGYDPAPSTAERLEVGHPWEVGLGELLGNIRLAETREEATFDADVAVICVPTPHQPELDGTWETDMRAPFDLTYLREALTGLEVPVVVMSTVLPGDCARLSSLVSSLTYNPQFPAMGTTIADITNPEFILSAGPFDVASLWGPIVGMARYFRVGYETAELAKMAYNTFIGAKIGLANTVAWIAENCGADGPAVMDILASAGRRITSSAYMRPGLGDGGACHPRDQIALSWLAREKGVYDLFGALIEQRYAHSRWIADKASDYPTLPVVILGAEYKADSVLTDGSAALLLSHQTGWPIVDELPTEPHVIIIGVPHTRYETWDFSGHTVINPWSTSTT